MRQAPDLSAATLDREFLWAANTIACESSRLRDFTDLAGQYTRLLITSKYEQALTVLDHIDSDLGKSLWVLKNRFALLEIARGTAAQKDLLAQILAVMPIGEIAYLVQCGLISNQ